MIEIKVESELEKMVDQLSKIEPRQWPFVLSKALNSSAFIGREHLKSQIPRYIDRPTPYSLSSVRYSKATRQKLESEIFWARTQGKVSGGQYLKPQVSGGGRVQKGFERSLQAKGLMPSGWRAVPTPDLQRDQFGNVPRSTYNNILKVMGAMSDEAIARNYKAVLKRKGLVAGVKDLSKTKRKPKLTRYFAVTGQTRGGLPPGIYERKSFGALGIGSRRVFSFVRSVSYQGKFPFFEIMARKANEVFPIELDKAIEFALATSR